MTGRGARRDDQRRGEVGLEQVYVSLLGLLFVAGLAVVGLWWLGGG